MKRLRPIFQLVLIGYFSITCYTTFNLSPSPDRSSVALTNIKPTTLTYSIGDIPKWDNDKNIYFMHIGKAAGTSFRKSLRLALGPLCHCRAEHRSFDSISDRKNYALVTMLRHPVERVISHFYFTKTLKWGKKILENISIGEWLDYHKNPLLFRQTRTIWRDGQGAALWFSGLHNEGWTTGRQIKRGMDEIHMREHLAYNQTYMLQQAITNFHKFVYVGLLDELEDSLDLFRYQIGKRLMMTKSNFNRHKKNKMFTEIQSQKVRRIIASLIPVDMAFYDYAKRIIEHRIRIMRGEVNTKSDLQIPIPRIKPGCRSLNVGALRIDCDPESELKSLFFEKNNTMKNLEKVWQSLG